MTSAEVVWEWDVCMDGETQPGDASDQARRVGALEPWRAQGSTVLEGWPVW
jgi:hypothetical protein